MRRRELVTGLLLAAAPGWLQAQQTAKVYRIAVVDPGRPIIEMSGGAQGWPEYRAFFDELRRLGYIENQNLLVDRFGAEQHANKNFAEVAREIVRRVPDLIVPLTTPLSLALQKETQTIPIVFLMPTDPVSTGLVSSVTKPGGNLTGFTDYEYSFGGKWVELLKEISPPITRIAIPYNGVTAPFAKKFIQSAEAAATHLSVSLSANDIRDLPELERAIGAIAIEPNGGLVVIPDSFLAINYERFIQLAHQYHLPAIYPYPWCPRAGGLASYNFDHAALFRAGAGYIDRILRGAKPSDLPVQSPRKFDLIINLKTARTLGLTISPSLLARAEEVIE
jgi:putative tryptophan/tyrosine transport system substrate-binding protein